LSFSLKTLADYVWTAINKNYLLGILVTSQAEARVKSEGWSFGAGKSTFGLEFVKSYCYGGEFDEVKRHTISFVEELEPFLGPPRTKAIYIDDMQIDFGKHKSYDKKMQELAYFLTTQRTHIAVIVGSAPHRDMLQKDFREELFHFEVIIPKRGTFEIQRLKRWIPFQDPLSHRERLEPFGIGPFLSLTPEEQAWYDEWREARDQKAKARLRIFQKEDEKQWQPPLFREFETYARDVCKLRGPNDSWFKLWSYLAKTPEEPMQPLIDE